MQYLKKLPAKIAVGGVFLPLLLGACGFHLRGSLELPPQMQNIYFENASSSLTAEVQNTLRFSNARVSMTKPETGVIVNVLEEKYRRISQSISTSGKTNEFELYYMLEYEIRDIAGKILLPKKNMIITRSYYNDQTQLLAKSNEEILLRQQIYKQAGGNIVESARVALESSEKDGAVNNLKTP